MINLEFKPKVRSANAQEYGIVEKMGLSITHVLVICHRRMGSGEKK